MRGKAPRVTVIDSLAPVEHVDEGLQRGKVVPHGRHAAPGFGERQVVGRGLEVPVDVVAQLDVERFSIPDSWGGEGLRGLIHTYCWTDFHLTLVSCPFRCHRRLA